MDNISDVKNNSSMAVTLQQVHNNLKLKPHWFDLLWICCSPQQIHNILTCQDVVDLLYNFLFAVDLL